MAFPSAVEEWRRRGATANVCGREVFFVQADGDAPPVVFLHGFPSSSFDWRETLRYMDGRAWMALDFVGFGLSEKPREENDLRVQADIVEELLGQLGVEQARIVAHDMGTSVANELMARDLEGKLSFACDAVLLFNGSMVIDAASLTWEQKVLLGPGGSLLAGLSNRLSLKRGLGATFSEAHPLSSDEARGQWALMSHDQGHRNLHRLISYVRQRTEFADRWHGAIANWQGRLELAWGLEDPVATVAVLEALKVLRPSVAVHELPGLGHYPQIEDPARMAAIVRIVT